MTPAQKFGLKLKCNQRNDKKQKDNKGKKVDLSACSIKAVVAALQDSTTGGGGGEETESSNEDDDEVAQMKPPAQKKQKQGQVTAIIQRCRDKTVHEHPFSLECEAEGTMGQLYKQ